MWRQGGKRNQTLPPPLTQHLRCILTILTNAKWQHSLPLVWVPLVVWCLGGQDRLVSSWNFISSRVKWALCINTCWLGTLWLCVHISLILFSFSSQWLPWELSCSSNFSSFHSSDVDPSSPSGQKWNHHWILYQCDTCWDWRKVAALLEFNLPHHECTPIHHIPVHHCSWYYCWKRSLQHRSLN